jgi:hypothetical protein
MVAVWHHLGIKEDMKFTDLHETIPYAKGGKEKILSYSPYPAVVLAMPGRHALDTVPIGGDFVVMVTDSVFKYPNHQFTHTDIFKQVEELRNSNADDVSEIMSAYYKIVKGADPKDHIDVTWDSYDGIVGIISIDTFFYAVQCLAVAEHRRYAQYESKFGGRFLPFRFAAGIAEGLWTAADAANLQRKGRPGVEILEKMNGTPVLTQELMK